MNRSLHQPFAAGEANGGWDCQLTVQLRNSLRQLVIVKSVQRTLTCLSISLLFLSPMCLKSQTPPGFYATLGQATLLFVHTVTDLIFQCIGSKATNK